MTSTMISERTKSGHTQGQQAKSMLEAIGRFVRPNIRHRPCDLLSVQKSRMSYHSRERKSPFPRARHASYEPCLFTDLLSALRSWRWVALGFCIIGQ